MDVTDLSTAAAIRNFRRRQLGEVVSFPCLFQDCLQEAVPSFEVLSRTLEQLLSKRLTSDGLPLEAIERLKQEEEVGLLDVSSERERDALGRDARVGRTEGRTERASAEEGDRPVNWSSGEEEGTAPAVDREDSSETN